MNPVKPLPPQELLIHHPVYPVLVCRECRYAIQPAGIARHLKEIHHIYRSRRRPYMEYAARLELAKPHVIINTEITEFPVSHLPVLEGLQCMSGRDCRHLCVSVKRMQNHWLSAHGRRGDAAQGDWRAAPLQTFFRGNLLHYFTGEKNGLEQTRLVGGLKMESTSPTATHSSGSDSMDKMDQSLLRHYINSTSLTLVDRHGTENIWQAAIPHLAYQHSFLMHALLACAALHRAHQLPAQRRGYIVHARTHQDKAWPSFKRAITDVTSQNASAILAFAHLLVIYTFATDDDDDGDGAPLLLADPNSPNPGSLCSWLYFVRNGCLIVCEFWDQIENGPLGPIANSWESPIPGVDEDPAATDIAEHLRSLAPAMDGTDSLEPWSEQVRKVYSVAASQLGWAFAASWVLSDADFTTWDAVRVWPMQIGQEYIDLLTQGHAAALVLLAHYGLLLERLEPHWYFEGRAARLVASILERLGSAWKPRIRWSRERLGIISQGAGK